MTHRHLLDEADVGAVHLLERERVVEKRLLAHLHVELPVHHVGGDPLRIREARAIEFAKIGEPLPGTPDAIAPPLKRARRQLPLEAILFRAAEVPRQCRERGIAAHPVVGELAEEIGNRSRAGLGSGLCRLRLHLGRLRL